MKRGVILVLWLCCCNASFAQTFKSTQGEAAFFSSAPLEDITAKNTKVTSLFNGQTGAIAFVVPIKAFQFRKSLMQEHFNEKFMESDKFPQATFEGKLTGYDLTVSGNQKALAEGNMTIHGITQKVSIRGDFIFERDQLKMEAKFPIKLEDYKISIPKVLFHNIAEEVEVTVVFAYEKLN
jgi:hypothetical protein